MPDPGFDRRRFLGTAAASVAAGPLDLFSKRLEAMTETLAQAARQTRADATDIRPFRVSFPEAELTDLRHYNRLDKGGHFAAWEQPKLFVDEVRTGFRSLR